MSEQGGYAGRILRIDLSASDVTTVPTMSYAERFLGGRGIAAKVYWDEVAPETDALGSENRLIFMTGPVCGVPGFGSRFQICGKSPISKSFSYCNLGGSWGAHLKYAGYDGLVVHGRSEKPVYLWIDGDRVETRDAARLRGENAFSCERKIREEIGGSVRVLTVGPAGDNMVSMATFLAADDSCGSGGLAAVMGSKNLKAVAVSGRSRVGVADRKRLSEVRSDISKLKGGLPESMRNLGWLLSAEGLKAGSCHACPSGCVRMTYRKVDGEERKFMCQAALFYQTRAERYYGNGIDAARKATELCDDYGLDTRAIETMIMWLSRCFHNGILTEQQAGLPLSQIGSYEFIEALCRTVARREGFGDTLAAGTHEAARRLGPDAQKQIKDYMTGTGDNELYGPRLYITTGIFYAMEPRLPIQQLHEVSIPAMMWAAHHAGMPDVFVDSDVIRAMARRFFGSEMAVDFSTYEGKALAASTIQNREYAKESLILCDLAWPVYFSPRSDDHVGDPTLESRVCSAVTGRHIGEDGLYEIGERVFNLQRAILVREGRKGGKLDCIDEYNFTTPLKGDFGNPECMVPGENGEAFSRKGMVVDAAEFDGLKKEFYEVRGWDTETGLPGKTLLRRLALGEVADDLKRRGLMV